jgi:hypothetical protein
MTGSRHPEETAMQLNGSDLDLDTIPVDPVSPVALAEYLLHVPRVITLRSAISCATSVRHLSIYHLSLIVPTIFFRMCTVAAPPLPPTPRLTFSPMPSPTRPGWSRNLGN